MADSSSAPRPDPDDGERADAIAAVTAGLFGDHNLLGLEEYLELFEEIAERNRFAVLFVLSSEEKMSATELGEALGRSENGLHYHLNRLVNAGLIENRKQAKPDAEGLYSYYELTGLGADLTDAVTTFIQEEKHAFEHY
ncbi:winged helix-turn-helix domain-containing protein [Halanaeroarchaeum sulfurireducens]|uniref:MarR family transcriptional regulator n=1 Tax=Halanaeroarchaeum sulfurireducens TaxID=1604004 RepID=A0A0F7PDH5_9EURY|nr:winged helix-turn-helix domain-containing protein [Halanaeroarchaeum sulfurireducens]AKH98717.1 MarR family transcriptional regulator [Halanaeroarchaeum sulfurireducens]ALG83161.1 MarR family transcriptional regulator [Halanaeroarchaeum sulfurireducens]